MMIRQSLYSIYIYISSEWLRTCERYPGVAKSYLIMRRTPLDKSQLIRCPYEIRNYVWFFLVRHGPLVKPWWRRNELAELYDILNTFRQIYPKEWSWHASTSQFECCLYQIWLMWQILNHKPSLYCNLFWVQKKQPNGRFIIGCPALFQFSIFYLLLLGYISVIHHNLPLLAMIHHYVIDCDLH